MTVSFLGCDPPETPLPMRVASKLLPGIRVSAQQYLLQPADLLLQLALAGTAIVLL